MDTELPSWRFDVPEGGFGLWLNTDDRVDETRLVARAIEGGVSFDRGSWFRSKPSQGVTQMRLCFSAASEDAMTEGVRKLAARMSADSKLNPQAWQPMW